MPVIETYFLDTNILVKTSEYLRVKEEGGDVSKLESYYAFLLQTRNDGHKLIISRISILEMYFLYHRWFYYKKKVEERASFDEIFGREATYELEDQERTEIEDIIEDSVQKSKSLGIEFSNVDQNDVLELTEILYKGSRPSVEPYNLIIYANSILECSKCLVTDDRQLRKAIDYLRKQYKEEIRKEIINRFGEAKYPYWIEEHDLPSAYKPKANRKMHKSIPD
ncbi:MAG: hypothetical protein N2V75_10675 [Methanophagales archaeon]|nr:hypothetical protein [Methanophagales archaeon]